MAVAAAGKRVGVDEDWKSVALVPYDLDSTNPYTPAARACN